VQITETNVIPQLKECTFRIACDVTNPLCGEQVFRLVKCLHKA
jgi:glycerate kinase